MNIFYARTCLDKEWQTLEEHLTKVAKLCESFCVDEDKSLGYKIGLLHDLGKFQDSFQERLKGKNITVDHATFGAQAVIENQPESLTAQIISYVIASHHTGLNNGGMAMDLDNSTLAARLKKQFEVNEEYVKYLEEAALQDLDTASKQITFDSYFTDKKNFALRFSTKIRMLLSALVDADWLDSETFCNGKQDRGNSVEFSLLLQKLNARISKFKSDTPINKARHNFSEQALNHIKSENSLFKLDMPTGSGKTLMSMRFALNRLIEKNKKRIIYVVPYTSIIDQNAKELKEIFGEENVIEHHSNFDIEKLSEEEQEKYKFATENWDAPIIITTNLQFFESFYSNKNSRLRKLHNLCDSVICFDEIQTIPLKCLQPCYDAIKVLSSDYGADAVFMTATMPNPDKFNDIFALAEDLVDDKTAYSLFKRSAVLNRGEITLNEFCSQIDTQKSNLIVTNTKKQARVIFNKITTDKKYLLTTLLMPNDRKRIIGDIKNDLEENVPITVVSTSLVEAGVDLDFENAYRWINGVDSILQCAGRCNREGKRNYGETKIFWLSDVDDAKNSETKVKIQITKNLINKYNDIDQAEPCREYFEQLFTNKIDTVKMLELLPDYFSKTNLLISGKKTPFFSVSFLDYARDFRYMEDSTVDLIIKNEESEKILKQLEFAQTVTLKRKLQKYVISIYDYDLKKLLSNNSVSQTKDGIYCLEDRRYYDEKLGLIFDLENQDDFITT
ncbi:MAG TPA: CRISPR-associated helicase Cas3' [Clostridia bacterium]|nr:CRISPR-associated helicase Cas3' [Clostridia bacterium]